MDKGTETTEETGTGTMVGSEEQTQELAEKAGLSHVELREDGAIVFGNGCLILKPTDDNKLKLTIAPTKCGEATGKVVLDYLLRTAGKGVIIEIPPVEEKQE